MTIYAERARFMAVEQGFNIKRPPLEPRAFTEEPVRAFSRQEPTGTILLDLSDVLGTDYPPTTPFLLTRYVRMGAGEMLETVFAASGELWAVLKGAGSVTRGSGEINWAEGDLLAFPGGVASRWTADEDSVLWTTTDEPMLAFAHVRPEMPERAPMQDTHFRAEEIAGYLEALYRRDLGPETPGRAIFMATSQTQRLGTCLPSLTLTLNAVRPGEAQRPHRHNAAAIVLALREAACTSHIGGKTFRWIRYSTILTPPGEPHSHRNAQAEPDDDVATDDIALALIVQDGGLYYYARTMGFSFDAEST